MILDIPIQIGAVEAPEQYDLPERQSSHTSVILKLAAFVGSRKELRWLKRNAKYAAERGKYP
jgi:hypothetical protein